MNFRCFEGGFKLQMLDEWNAPQFFVVTKQIDNLQNFGRNGALVSRPSNILHVSRITNAMVPDCSMAAASQIFRAYLKVILATSCWSLHIFPGRNDFGGFGDGRDRLQSLILRVSKGGACS